jgi:predicted nucleic acid-binding protein
MADAKFFDTNILFYASFDDKTSKYPAAQALVHAETTQSTAHISTQVLNEFTVNAMRKGKKTLDEAEAMVDNFMRAFQVHSLTPSVCKDAFRIAKQYGFSFWDSLIVAAALECGCATLYTEDLQDGQVIDETLTICNPLRPGRN